MNKKEFEKQWNSIKRKIKLINLECNGYRMTRIFTDSYKYRVYGVSLFVEFYFHKYLIAVVFIKDISMISEGSLFNEVDKNE